MRISKKWKFILRQNKIIFIPIKKAAAMYHGGFFMILESSDSSWNDGFMPLALLGG